MTSSPDDGQHRRPTIHIALRLCRRERGGEERQRRSSTCPLGSDRMRLRTPLYSMEGPSKVVMCRLMGGAAPGRALPHRSR